MGLTCPSSFEAGDFTAARIGDRFTARAALDEGKRIKAGKDRDPDREDHCHGYANCCHCPTCSLSPKQRELRRRLDLLPSTSAKEPIAA